MLLIMGTKYGQITGCRLSEGIRVDLTRIPQYQYSQVIPRKYRRDDVFHDLLVAATLLCHHNYMTEWQLAKVCDWVKRHDYEKVFEALKTCRAIQKGE